MENRDVEHPWRFDLNRVPGYDNRFDLVRAEGKIKAQGTPYCVETTVPPALAQSLGLDPKTCDIATALEALRQLASAPSEMMKVKRFEATGTYPARYELGCTPPYAIARGHASGGKTAVSIIFPGPASNGGTVTVVDQSGVTQNFYMAIEGSEIVISQSPGGSIAGAHNVRGEFENFIFPAAASGSGGGGGGTYILPQATANTLGGVKVQTRTSDQTAPVGIDPETGLIYTRPGGGSGMKEYTSTTPAGEGQKRMTTTGGGAGGGTTPEEGELFAATFTNGNTASDVYLAFGGTYLQVKDGQIPRLAGYKCVFYRDGNAAQLLNPQGRVKPTLPDSFVLDPDTDKKVQDFTALFAGTKDGEFESFVFFTDPHLGFKPEKTGELLTPIKQAYRRTPTDFVLCGGDWLDNNDTTPTALYKLGSFDGWCRKNLAPYVPVFGNHDTNYQNKEYRDTWPDLDLDVGIAHMLPQHLADSIMFRREGRAYYIYKGLKSTIFVLDTEISRQVPYWYEQMHWLCRELIKQDAHHSFVAAHIATSSRYVTDHLKDYTKIMAAYNQRKSITIYDQVFDFAPCSGTCHFVLAGHEHEDLNIEVNGIPVIVTTEVKDTSHDGKRWPTFELVLADYASSILHLVRIGNGASRDIPMLSSSGVIQSGVIQDGLALYLDGKDRGGVSGKWKDKVSGSSFTMTECAESDTGVTFNGSSSMGYAEGLQGFRRSGHTVEIVMQPTATDYVAYIGLPYSDTPDDLLIFSAYAGQYYHSGGNTGATRWWGFPSQNPSGLRTVSINDERGMENKVALQHSDKTSSYTPGGLARGSYIGTRQAGDYKFQGTIYAIRVYNRLLSEGEMLRNQTDDLRRYGGAQ